jgi:hypothetical protein
MADYRQEQGRLVGVGRYESMGTWVAVDADMWACGAVGVGVGWHRSTVGGLSDSFPLHGQSHAMRETEGNE